MLTPLLPQVIKYDVMNTINKQNIQGIVKLSLIMGLSIAYTILPIFIVLGVIRKYIESTWGRCKSKTPLTGKVFLITGANSGLGKETAKELAKRNACVIMACRDLDRAKSAIHDIRKTISSGELIPIQLDLASFNSIKEFSEEVLQRFPKINVLINNAGVHFPVNNTIKTVEGFEINYGVNHLGHFLLTKYLIERIKESAPSRVVVVTSTLGEDSKRKGKRSSVNPSYPSSKLANALFARELSKRLKGTGVDVYAVCPGFCYTGLFRYSDLKFFHYLILLPVGFFFMRTAWQGAQTILHCATDESLTGTSGNFYRNCKIYKYKTEFTDDLEGQLWLKSEEEIKTT